MDRCNGRGMKTYDVCLQSAQVQGVVGVNKQIRAPQPETSRLGFRGKKAKKTDMKLIAAKLSERVHTNPHLQKAYENVVRFVGKDGGKKKEKETELTTPELIKQLEALRKQNQELREEIKAEPIQVVKPVVPSVVQSTVPVKKAVVQETTQAVKAIQEVKEPIEPPMTEERKLELLLKAKKKELQRLAAGIKAEVYPIKLSNVAG